MPIPEKVSANSIYSQSMHWSKRKKLADLYHRSLLPYRNIKSDLEYPVDVSYDFTFKNKPLDCSNCGLMAKLIEDGLVQYKILRGDTPSDVGFINISSKKGTKDEVEITIN